MNNVSPPTDQGRHDQNGCQAPYPPNEIQEDFALVQLDTRFVTLLSEIAALETKRGRGIVAFGRERPQEFRSDETSLTRKIESVLRHLKPVERAIMATPARSIVGLGIKARHAAYVVSEHWDAPIEQIDWDAQAVRLLIEEICKVAGVRLPFPTEAGQ